MAAVVTCILRFVLIEIVDFPSTVQYDPKADIIPLSSKPNPALGCVRVASLAAARLATGCF